ncbi:MAG: hypothetical protein M0R06_17515 [Sphaerochaeta sp.]|nr:hypothetical protein [Sphaerochaeta sp.]
MSNNQNHIIPLTSSDLLTAGAGREFILIGGKDGVGKTSALISIAMVVNGKVDNLDGCVIYNPGAKVYVLDTEHKFASVYRQFGASAPDNIIYYYCQTMDELLLAFGKVLEVIKPGDWIMVESMARIWEHTQDLAYREVTGLSKAEFLAKRRSTEGRKGSPIPQPDHFWNIAKSAHDAEFLQVLVARDDINVAMTTILTRPPKESPTRSENIDRKELRLEFGIDSSLGGTPTLPYQPETLVLLDRVRGDVKASVLRDNNSALEDGRVEFWVPTKKSFGPEWMRNCRVAQDEE